MSRSGYSDDYDFMELYRANVDRTVASKRGQMFLRQLAEFMDAMPEKKLIAHKLINAQGECCTMGVVFKAKNLDVSKIDPEDGEAVGKAVGISAMMAAEIAYMNDEYGSWKQTPEERWVRMRQWVSEQLK